MIRPAYIWDRTGWLSHPRPWAAPSEESLKFRSLIPHGLLSVGGQTGSQCGMNVEQQARLFTTFM